MRHMYCPEHQETQLHSVEKLFALGHSRCGQAAAKLCEVTQASRRRRGRRHRAFRKCARLEQTIAPRMCRALRTAQTHECLPSVFQDALRAARRGQPADIPTPREQQNTQVKAHRQILKLAEKEMEAKKTTSRVDPAFCTLQLGNKRLSQAQSIRSAKTVSSKWAKHPTVAVKELMDRVARYLTSMRNAGKWSHPQHSSCAAVKHHDTSNKKTIKHLPHHLFVSVPQRTTTRCDAKTADVMPFFSTKDDSNKLPLKTTASWKALSGEQSQCRSAEASFRHHPQTCLRVQNVTCVVQCVGSGNVGTPNVSSTTEATKKH